MILFVLYLEAFNHQQILNFLKNVLFQLLIKHIYKTTYEKGCYYFFYFKRHILLRKARYLLCRTLKMIENYDKNKKNVENKFI